MATESNDFYSAKKRCIDPMAKRWPDDLSGALTRDLPVMDVRRTQWPRTGKWWWTIHWQSPRAWPCGVVDADTMVFIAAAAAYGRRRAAARSDSISAFVPPPRPDYWNSLSALFQRREKRKSWCAQLTRSVGLHAITMAPKPCDGCRRFSADVLNGRDSDV